MRIKATSLTLITVFCCLTTALASASTTGISWVRLNFPPNYIIKGENAGNGVYEIIIRFIGDRLEQYEMHYIDMSRKRFWHELGRVQNYCDVGVQKNIKRQDTAYYSIPITLIPPALIVLNQEKWLSLGRPKTMKLLTLLEDNRLKGAIMSKRSYGTSIDGLLNDDANKPISNLQRKYIKLPSLFSMVSLKRLDYTIDYDAMVNMFLRENNLDNLKFVEIEEELKYHSLHIACTKNKWGKQVINAINGVLKQHRTSSEFRQSFSAWGEEFNGPFFQRYKEDLRFSR